MRKITTSIVGLALAALAQAQIPALKSVGDTKLLNVDGQPLVMMAGALHNSTASSAAYMREQQVFERLKAMNLNTVLATVSWELTEPTEGTFDFALVDTLIAQAERHDMKLALLWFGTFKNPFMTYAPSWVKRDPKRFPRALDENGRPLESLSVFHDNILKADTKAYCALLQHLKKTDARHTVVMIQIENESGLRGAKRDHSPLAEKAWKKNGAKWAADYRKAHPTADVVNLDEQVFMAHGYAAFLQKIAAAGKKVYPLPTFTNASVFGMHSHGVSLGNGCSIPELLDIYLAEAPAIDLFTPNAYMQELDWLCRQYHTKGNAVFIPESTLKAARALYAFGEHHATAFSPFAVDAYDEERTEAWKKDAELLGQTYATLQQMDHLLTDHMGHNTLRGIYLYPGHEADSVQMDKWKITFTPRKSFDIGALMAPATGQQTTDKPRIQEGGALVVQTAKDEFYVVGYGFDADVKPIAEGGIWGYDTIQEGCFRNGQFVGRRILNGDERNVYAPYTEVKVFKVNMYEAK